MTQVKDKISVDELQAALLDEPEFLKGIVNSALQKILDRQFENHIQAGKYERTEERRGYRNGGYEREIRTRVGSLMLRVSRDRAGTFCPQLFARYKRNEKALVMTIAEMYLKGVSTRKVESILEELCGLEISKSQVSELAKEVEQEIKEWAQRRLDSDYEYLFVDALVLKVRENGAVVTRAALVGIGVKTDGYREVIACEIADSENEGSWAEFFENLKRRGLQGIRLVISDHHAGLRKAIGVHFQGVLWQRCQVHFMRNFLGSFSKTEQSKWVQLLKDVFMAPELEQAKSRAKELVARLREKKKEKQARWIEESIEDCLAVYQFPEEHRKKLRTTNISERLNREIRRRATVIGVFPSRESALRIVASESMDATERWMGRRYMEMSHVMALGI
jgi:putative transposase